jgi:hypothetical protein
MLVAVKISARPIVGELDGEVLILFLAGVLTIRSMFDVGEELVEEIHFLSQIILEIHLMIIESVGLSLDVGGLLPKKMSVHRSVDVDEVPSNDVGFADIVKGLCENK